MPMPFAFPARLAEPAEAEAITAIVNLAFQVEKFFIDGDRIDCAQVRELFKKGWFLVIDAEDTLAGCVYVEPRGSRAYLGLLSVHPGLQGHGLGAQLVAAAEGTARARDCHAMDLRIVSLRRELPPFYRRLGYVETGATPFTPGAATKLPCHFIEMSKPLRGERAKSAS
jgi:GNAT superfamily N-acetyltransferase